MSKDIILDVNNLITRFQSVDGTVHAVNGVSFHVAAGETLGVVGESGSGKSVTMMSLVGLIPQPPGQIVAGTAVFTPPDSDKQVDLLRLKPAELQKIQGAQIGFIFQDPISSLNPVLTIGSQIAESLIIHQGLSNTVAKQKTIDLLTQVGIPDPAARYTAYPHQFSGGMRQRVMIAIAIACAPQLVIADEPTTALDVTVQAQIIELVQHIQGQLGMAVIWISHDLGVVAGLADRVMVMYGGTVVETATVDDLYENPQHPYTIGLLNAIPHLPAIDEPEQELVSIHGTPPDLLTPLRQCPFAPRCPYVFDKCWQELPRLTAVSPPHHHVACFYDVNQQRSRHE
ncbi:MAG TPA: ABC transporter ATP-binding protein [Anaerolineae bacterium]|nr:ABC transporter ATP-binding protein [Anaerolineae bacterium]